MNAHQKINSVNSFCFVIINNNALRKNLSGIRSKKWWPLFTNTLYGKCLELALRGSKKGAVETYVTIIFLILSHSRFFFWTIGMKQAISRRHAASTFQSAISSKMFQSILNSQIIQ